MSALTLKSSLKHQPNRKCGCKMRLNLSTKTSFLIKSFVTQYRYCILNQNILSFLNSFPASGDFCRLLITFANSLDLDQARQNVGPDLDPNCLTLWWYSRKIFFKNVNLKKKHRWQKKHAELLSMQRVEQLPYLETSRNTNQHRRSKRHP